MTLEIKRLHLASLQGLDGGTWPVHGFVVTHPGGAVLVDTGVGGPQDVLDDWRVVNRSVADALAELDMSPADIGLVINTHLHFDHCGQNAVFKHAPFYVQRAELSRMRRESSELYDWFGFMNARFELLDGDTEVLPGLEVIATPGHTEGHQCVVVRGRRGVRPAHRRRGLHAPAVRRTRPRQPPARPGQRRRSLARIDRENPLPATRTRAFLPSHGYRAQLTASIQRRPAVARGSGRGHGSQCFLRGVLACVFRASRPVAGRRAGAASGLGEGSGAAPPLLRGGAAFRAARPDEHVRADRPADLGLLAGVVRHRRGQRGRDHGAGPRLSGRAPARRHRPAAPCPARTGSAWPPTRPRSCSTS